MIIGTILNVLLVALTFVLGLITLPAMPVVILEAFNNVLSWLETPIGIVRNYVGDTFLLGITVAIVAYILMSPIIHLSIWLYQRIKS